MLLPTCIVDGFLSEDAADGLLSFVLENEERFRPSRVYEPNPGEDEELMRRSLSMNEGTEEALAEFHAAIDARFEHLRTQTRVPEFTECEREADLVAHLDGHHYKFHVDTLSESARNQATSDRMISMVYYFHREPRAFSGGELKLYGIGGDETQLVEPRHNRLIAFPSMTPHEVLPISLPGNAFADARFSIACWLTRARG